MRPDTGNRAFWQLAATAALSTVLVTASVCCVAYIVASQVWADGSAAGLATLAPGMALVTLAVIGLALAAGRLVIELRQVWRLRRGLQAQRRAVPTDLQALAADAGLPGRLDLIPADGAFAFTYGLLRPRVALSSGLHGRMSPRELHAVLAHERSHARSRDPLKLLVARVLLAREFYVPALRSLHGRFVAGRELAADRAAVAACGRKPLAAALLKVADEPGWAGATAAAAIAGPGLLTARVLQLERGVEPELDRPSRGMLLYSLLGVAVAAWAVTGSTTLLMQYCNGC